MEAAGRWVPSYKLYAPMFPFLQHSLGKTYECHRRPPAPNPRDTGAMLIEEIGKECASTAATMMAHTSLGTAPIAIFGNDDQKAVISESMVVPQLTKEYLSDMCCIVDSSMVVMFNFISKVLTFEFSGFQDYISDLKDDERFTNARLNYCTKWLSAYLATD